MANSPTRAQSPSLLRFLDYTQTHTPGRTSLCERSSRGKVATCTTHSKRRRRTSMPSAGFEPAIPAIKRSHTYSLKRTATRIGIRHISIHYYYSCPMLSSTIENKHGSLRNHCSHKGTYVCIQYALYFYPTLTLRRLMSYIYMEHPFLMFLDLT